MTSPIKKANMQRELDALAFSVLANFRHQGAMQWTDWYETTRARRGKVGLGTSAFSQTVKRLNAQGRAQVDGDGCYRVAGGELTYAENSLAVEPKPSSGVFLEAFREAEAEIAKLRAENKQLLDWIMGNADALTCLQSIYQSPESSEHTKIKAATGALPFERPKLSVAVSVRGSDVLGECLDAAKAMKVINPPETIDHEA